MVEIKTDGYPGETGWYVSVGNEVIYNVPKGTYQSGTLIPDLYSGDYQLTVTDSNGDGIYDGNAIV